MNRSSYLAPVVALVLVGVLAGCGKPITKADVAGTWVVDYGFAIDTLTFKENGQLTQTIKIKSDGRTVTKQSSWVFIPDERSIRIETNYMAVIDGHSRMIPNFDDVNTNSMLIGPVGRVFGHLEIGGDDLPWGRTGVEAPYKKQR